MKLHLADGTIIASPSANELEHNIRSLPGGIDSFLVLERKEMTYVQVAGGTTEPFALEYQEGSLEFHFRATDEVSVETVVQVFQSYASGANDWKNLVQWEPQNLSSSQNSSLPIAVGVGFALVAAILLFWWQRAT